MRPIGRIFWDYDTALNPISLWFAGEYYIYMWTENTSVQYQISTALGQIATYQTNLQYYLSGHYTLTPLTNPPPVEQMSSFLLPFTGMDDYGFSLISSGGAIWNYSGNTNVNSLTSSDTNATAGEIFKQMYPDARRTMLITGMAPGNFDVYVLLCLRHQSGCHFSQWEHCLRAGEFRGCKILVREC